MVVLIRRNYCIIFLFSITFVLTQESELRVIEFRPFPDEMKLLELNPTKLNWSIGNRFLLLDDEKNQLFDLAPSGDLNLSIISGLENSIYGQLIWMGLAPDGLRVVDRLENQILFLDHRLNLIQKISIKPSIYPELVSISHWGSMYMYSQTYNAIFLFDRLKINVNPLIDFSRSRLNSHCFVDMSSNNAGDLALLNCENEVIIFGQNGKFKFSFFSDLPKPIHLIPFNDDWLLFNADGKVTTVKTRIQYSVPKSSIPVLDVESMGNFIAILTRDHISILDVK